MLVLSRKPGERIRIGQDVYVEVRRVTGNRVTIAIDAPEDVHILRGELEPFADQFADDTSDQHGAAAYRAEYYRVPRKYASGRRVEAASA